MHRIRSHILELTLSCSTLAVFVGGAKAQPLDCPQSTSYRRVEIKARDQIIESCRDAEFRRQGPFRITRLSNGSLAEEARYVDGQEEGLACLYSANGEKLECTEYSRGNPVHTQYTPAGLASFAMQVQASMEMQGKKAEVYPSGDGGMNVVFSSGEAAPASPLPLERVQKIRERTLPFACRMLTRDGGGLKFVNFRLHWAGGEIAFVEKFRTDQCEALRQPAVSPNPSIEPTPNGAAHVRR